MSPLPRPKSQEDQRGHLLGGSPGGRAEDHLLALSPNASMKRDHLLALSPNASMKRLHLPRSISKIPPYTDELGRTVKPSAHCWQFTEWHTAGPHVGGGGGFFHRVALVQCTSATR